MPKPSSIETLVDSSNRVPVSLDGGTGSTVVLGTSTASIGKLAANSGVDIGDIDVTSIAAGDNNIGNVDVVTINSVAPQFDDTDKIAVSLYGKGTAAGDTPVDVNANGVMGVGLLTSPYSTSDGWVDSTNKPIEYAGNNSILFPTGPTLFNGTTWDRQRNNHEVTALASAARTASVDSADLANYNARGVVVVIDVTAITATPSITVTIQGKSTLGSDYYTILASAAITGTGQTVLRVYPGLVAAANSVVNDVLPRVWRVSVVNADADEITYSVSANYVL